MSKRLERDWFNFDIIRDHSLVEKAGSSLDVLKRVLEAIHIGHFEAINTSLLKSLYYLLVYLSRDSTPVNSNSGSSECLGFRSYQSNCTAKFTDICDVSNYLFNELSRRSEQLLSDLCNIAVREEFERSSLCSGIWGYEQDITLLLRCCMVILHLLELDQSLLLEKCQTLLRILSRLCSPELVPSISECAGVIRTSSTRVTRSVSRDSKCGRNVGLPVEECDTLTCSAEQTKLPVSVLCSILEVFLDELLVHIRLRHYFISINSVSCTTEMPFLSHISHGDINAVSELISSHFLLAVSHEQELKSFAETMFHGYREQAPSHFSLAAAVQLLNIPSMFSAPHIFRAYMISLVSRCIGIDGPLENQRVDSRIMSVYLPTFEWSFNTYTKHISSLKMEDIPLRAKDGLASCDEPSTSGRGSCPSFEYYIKSGTYKSVNLKIDSLADIEHSFLCETKFDLTRSCKLYMKEKEHILEKSYRSEILSVLNCIVSKALCGELVCTVFLKSRDVSQHEMLFLAAIIHLMSGSLLRAIWFMQDGSLDCRKTLNDYACCREYDVIIGIISCIQLLPDMMGVGSKMMLFHFAGLLQFSLNRGLQFLWKSCLFMMMTLMNLVVFEDGNVEALKPLFGFVEESPVTTSEVLVNQSTSLAVNCEEILMLDQRRDPCTSYVVEPQCGLSETSASPLLLDDNVCEEGICNGKMVLELQSSGYEKPDDFDELADFIVCKRDRDYPTWFEDRSILRKSKLEKLAKARLEKIAQLSK